VGLLLFREEELCPLFVLAKYVHTDGADWCCCGESLGGERRTGLVLAHFLGLFYGKNNELSGAVMSFLPYPEEFKGK
jgi:hypothetical protein